MPINPRTAARLLAGAAAVAVLAFLVVRLTAPTIESAHLIRYRLAQADNRIVVTVARGHCDAVKDSRAEESATSVRIAVLVERSRGTCTADIVFEEVVVPLADPLGPRAVLDEAGSPLAMGSIDARTVTTAAAMAKCSQTGYAGAVA